MNGGFGNIEKIGNFFAAFTVSDECGDLHFLGSQENIGSSQALQKR